MVAFFVALSVIPENPRYLVLRRKKDKAEQDLTKLLGAAAAKTKVDEIAASLASDHHIPKLKDLIDPKTKRLRKLTWVRIGLATFQQLVGITSCSITARCCGNRLASRKAVRC